MSQLVLRNIEAYDRRSVSASAVLASFPGNITLYLLTVDNMTWHQIVFILKEV